MNHRGFANKLRLVLGIAMAVMVGVFFYLSEGGTLLTYLLPSIILILTLADFIGYLAGRDDTGQQNARE